MDPGEALLDFGKHKGRAIRELPTEYLAFLCCYEHEVAHGSDNVERVDRRGGTTERYGADPSFSREFQRYGSRQDPGPTEWLWENKADTIRAARQFAKDRNLCLHCLRRLVPIGDSRANGKAHPDWDGRTLHKQCYKLILDDD